MSFLFKNARRPPKVTTPVKKYRYSCQDTCNDTLSAARGDVNRNLIFDEEYARLVQLADRALVGVLVGAEQGVEVDAACEGGEG